MSGRPQARNKQKLQQHGGNKSTDGAARAEALDGTLRLERALAVALEARPLICAVNARKQDFVAEKAALYCRVETGRAFKPINVGRRPRESMSLSLRKLRHYRVGSPHDATVCLTLRLPCRTTGAMRAAVRWALLRIQVWLSSSTITYRKLSLRAIAGKRAELQLLELEPLSVFRSFCQPSARCAVLFAIRLGLPEPLPSQRGLRPAGRGGGTWLAR